MTIDEDDLVRQMLLAARKTFNKKQWSDVRDYAEKELKGIASAIAFIEAKKAAGKMTAEEARLHLSIQKSTARTILLTLKGIGLLQAEAAINAALAVVKKVVNTAVGFALIA